MTLKELQKMIKEEFDTFNAMQQEAADDVDVDVDTDAGDMDTADAGMDPEATLKGIYDQLKNYFEGGGEDMGDMGDMDDDLADEEPADEDLEEKQGEDLEEKKEEELDEAPKDDEDTMEEAAAQGFGDAGNKKTSGKDSGYTPAKTTRGDGKLHEKKSPLQERFQKLANIIK